MNYIYDILINFNENLYDFYDWNLNDQIDHIRKIPVFKTDSEFLYNLKKNDIILNKDFLNKIYNKLSRKGADVRFLKKYILDERKEFAKDTKVLFKDLGSNAKFVVDEWFKAQAIKGLKEVEELEISDKKIFEKMKEGEFLFSVLDKSGIVYVPQKFLDSMTKNFKEYLPFLYGKTKPKFNNEKFFENL